MASSRLPWHTLPANKSSIKTVLVKVSSKRPVMQLPCNRALMTMPCPWLRISTVSNKTWHVIPSMSVMIRDRRATCSRTWTPINTSSNSRTKPSSSNAALLTAMAITTLQVLETVVVVMQTTGVETLALAKSSVSSGTDQEANNRYRLPQPKTVSWCTKVALRNHVPCHAKLTRTSRSRCTVTLRFEITCRTSRLRIWIWCSMTSMGLRLVRRTTQPRTFTKRVIR